MDRERFIGRLLIIIYIFLLVTFAGFFGFGAGGCGGGQDVIAPVVTSTDPSNNATDVPLLKSVTTTFNEDMDPSSVNSETFYVTDGVNVISGVVNVSGAVATFAPDAPLDPGTVYTAMVKGDVSGMNGQKMGSDYT